ncbi:MAG: ShlB/FhaC/HecB family hemolysin secretion/activation protein [Burkholderiaceae bacterium]
MIISWRQRLPLRLSLAADDSGISNTGKYQGTATVSYDNAFALNDLFYMSHTRALGGRDSGKRGLHASSAHYSIPFDYWLLSFNANDSQYYQTVAGANQNIVYSGASQTGEIKLSRLVYRDAYRKSTIAIKSWLRASQNFIDDTEVRVQRRRTAGWELGLNHREFFGSSTLDLSLNQRQGTGAFGARRAPEELFDEGTSRMRLTTTNIQLTIPFKAANQSLRYVGNVRAQWNQTLLVPQDRFLIGGRYSVRGFDGTNLLSADRGWVIRNEMAVALGSSGHETYVGIDHGAVSGRNSKNLIGTSLTGAVWGLRGSLKGLSYDLFIGTPISKPDGFKTSHITTGFNLNWSY